ncbi:MAG TPA: acetoacetate decarboxylase family protein [Chloroflexota bacterium]
MEGQRVRYPPPPWTLRGVALQTVQRLDAQRVRHLVPAPLEVLALGPAGTLGGVYLAAYGPGSTLSYHELIVVASLVHHDGRLGAWVSSILVDDEASAAGGREIWGLPKVLATFHWEPGPPPRITVRQGEEEVCSLAYQRRIALGRLRLPLPVFGARHGDLVYWRGTMRARPGLASFQLTVPPTSPLAGLGLKTSGLGICFEDALLTVPSPIPVGRIAPPPR